MRLTSIAATMLSILAATASAQTMGKGLTWAQFQKYFSSYAGPAAAGSVGLADCKDELTFNKKARAFDCKLSEAGFISGIEERNGAMRDATVTYLAVDKKAIADLKMASLYLILATQSGKISDVTARVLILDLMRAAFKSPSKGQSKVAGEVRYTATFEPSGLSGPTWYFSSEPQQ